MMEERGKPYIGYTGINNDDAKTSKNRVMCVVVVLTMVNLAIMTAVIVITFSPPPRGLAWPGGGTGESGAAAPTCVPCRQLEEGLYEDESREMERFTRTDGGKTCCTKTPQDLPLMLSLILEGKLRNERAKGTFQVEKTVYLDRENTTMSLSAVKPAAHLLGFHGQGSRQVRTRQATYVMTPVTNWNRKNQSFMVNGIDYTNGRLIIPNNGLFYVYSQVYFKKTNASDSRRDAIMRQTISHAVYRYNSKYPHTGEEKLLENAESVCDRPLAGSSEHTSYLGAVVSLRATDEVFVKVSDTNMISDGPKSNYFGLYLV